ncbi:hypothetical protein PVAP13_4NG085464 [Panicum virgatum]|uniref:Uncharacterized protein n=1 Tax=Panicum virgatum TaxID=38727 RepID=A0A8T0T915_PANVG|nr:hypothetical protein PVAP13_4NG085464 [Panicum virgatum]
MALPRWVRKFLWRSLCILSRIMSQASPMTMPPNVGGRQWMEFVAKRLNEYY